MRSLFLQGIWGSFFMQEVYLGLRSSLAPDSHRIPSVDHRAWINTHGGLLKSSYKELLEKEVALLNSYTECQIVLNLNLTSEIQKKK